MKKGQIMMKRRTMGFEKKHNYKGYIFVFPWIIGFFAFFLYPMIFSLRLSFSNINITMFTMSWVGVEHYFTALTRDTEFIPMLVQSCVDTLFNLPVIITFSIFMAMMLNRRLVARSFFRVAFFLPLIIGTGYVMDTILGRNISAAWQVMAGANYSVNDGFMQLQGIVMSDNLTMVLGPELALFVQDILNRLSKALWTSGIQTIIFLGVLQSIPVSYYEAAYCDGATEWDKFWLITLPIITPAILLNTVYTLIDSFTNIDNKVIKYAVDMANTTRFGFSSAMSWIYFLVIGTMVGLIFLLTRKSIYDANK